MPKKAEHGTPITSNNKYDLLFGVTTSEALWKFAERDVLQGFEGERRDRIIRTYVRNAYVYHLTEIFYTVRETLFLLLLRNLLILTGILFPIKRQMIYNEEKFSDISVFYKIPRDTVLLYY